MAAWALALAWLAGVYAMVASYDGNGGHLHPRYLFPGLAVLAVVVAHASTGSPGPAVACGSPSSPSPSWS